MNRGLDEIVADLLKDVDRIQDNQIHTDKRVDLSVKRLVIIESRLEDIMKRLSAIEDKQGDKN
jgi:hypothetical protein